MAGTRERKEARLKLFVSHYLANGQADAAARAAGYKGTPGSLRTIGSRLLTEVDKAGLIDKARERVQAKVDRGLEEWTRRLWEQADQGAGSAESQESWKGDDGHFHTKKYKPQAALIALAPLYAPKGDAPAGGQHVHFHLPADMAKDLYERRLKGQLAAGA